MNYKEYFESYSNQRQSLQLSAPTPEFREGATLVQFAQSGADREATSRNRWVENFSVPEYAQKIKQDYYPCKGVETVVVRLRLNSPAHVRVMTDSEGAIDWNHFQSLDGWHW